MRIAAIVLGAFPFLVSMFFLVALGMQTGPEGFGVITVFLYACIGLALFSAAAVVLSFIRRPPSGLDIPARVVSIASSVFFVPTGAFGLLFIIMAAVDSVGTVPA